MHFWSGFLSFEISWRWNNLEFGNLIDVINECDRMSRIFNRKHEFEKYSHKGNDETFYCLNTKQLGEYWHCVIEDQRVFCPEKCDECEVCKAVIEVLENLQDA